MSHFKHFVSQLSTQTKQLGEAIVQVQQSALDGPTTAEAVAVAVHRYQANQQALARLVNHLEQYGYCDNYADKPPHDPLQGVVRDSGPPQGIGADKPDGDGMEQPHGVDENASPATPSYSSSPPPMLLQPTPGSSAHSTPQAFQHGSIGSLCMIVIVCIVRNIEGLCVRMITL